VPPAKVAAVSVSGTPRFALGLSGAAAVLLILTGTFEQIMALGAVAFVFNYISAYTAVFVLRRCEPTVQRPYWSAFRYRLQWCCSAQWCSSPPPLWATIAPRSSLPHCSLRPPPPMNSLCGANVSR